MSCFYRAPDTREEWPQLPSNRSRPVQVMSRVPPRPYSEVVRGRAERDPQPRLSPVQWPPLPNQQQARDYQKPSRQYSEVAKGPRPARKKAPPARQASPQWPTSTRLVFWSSQHQEESKTLYGRSSRQRQRTSPRRSYPEVETATVRGTKDPDTKSSLQARSRSRLQSSSRRSSPEVEAAQTPVGQALKRRRRRRHARRNRGLQSVPRDNERQTGAMRSPTPARRTPTATVTHDTTVDAVNHDSPLVAPLSMDGGGQCPLTSCGIYSLKIRRHIIANHLPPCFRNIESVNMGQEEVCQSLFALRTLCKWVTGLQGDPSTLWRAFQDIGANELQSLVGELPASAALFCEMAGWTEPSDHTEAALLHPQRLALALSFTSYQQQERFQQLLAPRELSRPAEDSMTLDSAPQHPDDVLEITVADSDQEFSREMEERLLGEDQEVSQTDDQEESDTDATMTTKLQPQDPSEGSSIVEERLLGEDQEVAQAASMEGLEESALVAYDSHFHADRICKKLMHRCPREPLEFLEQLSPVEAPVVPVNLAGGVSVFCDPGSWPKVPFPVSIFKVAIGIHPKKVGQMSGANWTRFRQLIRHDHVAAVGEIGYDGLLTGEEARAQERVMRQVLEVAPQNKPLVVHVRGSTADSEESFQHCLRLMTELRNSDQEIHLHCFTGTATVVACWSRQFPNTYFGYTGKVTEFGRHQTLALQSVPEDRLLIETDGPYLCRNGSSRINLPQYIGKIGMLVANMRGSSLEHLLKVTTDNTRRLYYK